MFVFLVITEYLNTATIERFTKCWLAVAYAILYLITTPDGRKNYSGKGDLHTRGAVFYQFWGIQVWTLLHSCVY